MKPSKCFCGAVHGFGETCPITGQTAGAAKMRFADDKVITRAGSANTSGRAQGQKSPSPATSGTPKPAAVIAVEPTPVPEVEAGKRGRGRPGLGKPWEALGLGRTAYFAKKKAGELP